MHSARPALALLILLSALVTGCKQTCRPADCDPQFVCDGTQCVPRRHVPPLNPGPQPDAAADSGIAPDTGATDTGTAARDATILDVGLDDGAIPDVNRFSYYDGGNDAGVPDATRVATEAFLRVGEFDTANGKEHLIEGRFFDRQGYYSDVTLDYGNGCTLRLNRLMSGPAAVAYDADRIALTGFGADLSLTASVTPGIFVPSLASVPANIFPMAGAMIQMTVTPHAGSSHGIYAQTISAGLLAPPALLLLSPGTFMPTLYLPQDIDVVWAQRGEDISVTAELSDVNHEVVLVCVQNDFLGQLKIPAAAQGDWLSFVPTPPARLRVGYSSDQQTTIDLKPTGQEVFTERSHRGASWAVE
jgi:hypothetical protein